MRQAVVGRLRRTARRVKLGFGARALILLYHRIVDLPTDPHLLCVTPQHFAQHLEVLRTRYQVISLGQMTQAHLDGNLPRRSVVVTFDDGYADNLSHAKPLLERFEMPATVFVTTGNIDQEREFWWDELERMLLLPGELPPTLSFTGGLVEGITGRWELGEAASYSEGMYRQNRSWNVEQSAPGPRHRLFCDLYRALHPKPQSEQQEVLDRLRSWAGTDSRCRPTHRTLRSEELVELARGGLVEVGAHTVTHPILSAMPVPLQREEIDASKSHLERIIGRPVASFAYPYGLRSTYSDETVTAIQEAGFFCACSNYVDPVRRGADRFQLPRLVVQDWDGNTFARVLEDWLGEVF